VAHIVFILKIYLYSIPTHIIQQHEFWKLQIPGAINSINRFKSFLRKKVCTQFVEASNACESL